MAPKEEYASLRSEIIGLVSIQNNYVIAMYTITVAIITFAIQQKNEWIFLLPYIILFSFQRIISTKRNIMLRIAAYISVFLDEDFGWEKNYNDIVDNTLGKHNDKEKFSKFKNVISGRISSLQLGLVCSIGCIIICVIRIFENHKWIHWRNIILNDIAFIEVLPVFCSVLLFCALIDASRGALNAMRIRNSYIDSLTIYKNSLK